MAGLLVVAALFKLAIVLGVDTVSDGIGDLGDEVPNRADGSR